MVKRGSVWRLGCLVTLAIKGGRVIFRGQKTPECNVTKVTLSLFGRIRLKIILILVRCSIHVYPK